MEDGKRPVANPSVLLREEFDDWAVLFDPDTGHGFGLSPTSVYLWKLLDGGHSIDEMLRALRRDAADVPEEAGEQIVAFVEELAQHGLVAYDVEEFHDGRERILPRTTGIAENLPVGGYEAGQLGSGTLRYERPRLELFTLQKRAQGLCQSGSGDTGTCNTTGNWAEGSGCFGGFGCKSNGNLATGGNWSCAIGITATGGGSACTDGTSASGGSSYTCHTGFSGGGCSPNGASA